MTGSAATAAKLEGIADGLQSAIDDKYRDRMRNTPKQQRQAAEARLEGARLERTQKGLRALAAMHAAGTVPAALAGVKSKAAAYALAESSIKRDGGYYDAGICTGQPRDTSAAALAFWALFGGMSAEDREAEELRRKVDSLRFANIPGYFPTPAPLVARMIREAYLPEGADVLEPSAGSGAIADALKADGHSVVCVEVNSTLCDILKGKGHNVIRSDFREAGDLGRYDAVIMNPPFERGQDCEHVARAWEFVKPGGALVAIMGASVSFRKQRPYSGFRDFVEANGGTFEPIPAGTFAESGTGVASVLLTMTKREG
jgi:predicted RNA methylase